MDINQPINFNAQRVANISEIAPGHPVYKVSFNPENNSIYVSENETVTPSLVIKVENAARSRHVTDPIQVMNAIDPQAKTRRLSGSEVRALRSVVRSYNLPQQFPLDLDNATKPPRPGFSPPIIIVMKAKRNLVDLGSAGKRENNDKSGVKAIRKILNQPGTLEKLGKILAADAFIGNQDRVDFFRVGTMGAQKLQVIQNAGNFFFTANGNMPEVLGLDAIDPSNQFKDLGTFSTPINNAFRYPGELLRDQSAQDRQLFAQKLVDDIETILGSRNRKFPFKSQNHLPSNAGNQIVRGIVAGSTEIRLFLRDKYQNKTIPAEMRNRLTALGWLTQQGSIRL